MSTSRTLVFHASDRRGTTPRNHTVPSSFLTSAGSIGNTFDSPSRARASATGSKRFIATASSQNPENGTGDSGEVKSDSVGWTTGVTALTTGRTAMLGSVGSRRSAGWPPSAATDHSMSSGWCAPVYSLSNAVTPHGLGACTARTYKGVYGLSARSPIDAAASCPLILASTTFDHSPWMQMRDVPAGLLNT